MIPFDMAYYRPESAEEAVNTFARLERDGKRPMYYGGGTEILSDGRLNQASPGAVVDIKGVPECRRLERRGDRLHFGAARTLAEICEADLWPLLSDAAGRVADHTIRCKITLGGNIAGRIQYREAALPFLLVDGEATVFGPDGRRQVPFADVFDGALQLEPGAFLAEVSVPAQAAGWPHFCEKKTRLDWVDYPLVTVAALRGAETENSGIRLALSGYCAVPFRAVEMEAVLNAASPRGHGRVSADAAHERARRAAGQAPAAVVDDLHGSADYRRFVLTNVLTDAVAAIG